MKIPRRILLIEDDEDDQSRFIETLKAIDNTVLQYLAQNGKEALEYLSKAPLLPNLIFSDINMHILDGIQCLKEIIKNPHTRAIPVVMVSTDSRRADLALSIGARAFIDKNSHGKLLHEHIEHAIDQYSLNEIVPVQTFLLPMPDSKIERRGN